MRVYSRRHICYRIVKVYGKKTHILQSTKLAISKSVIYHNINKPLKNN